MGYVCNYMMGDVVVWFKCVQGFSVLYLMGWDVFGMFVENVVMEQGGYFCDWIYVNIVIMCEQLKLLGLFIDWSCEFVICDDNYVYQQQLMFLDMLEVGLIYCKLVMVNWDFVDMMVFVNEQVEDGCGWWLGVLVEWCELM